MANDGPTTYNRMVLKLESPYARDGGSKIWTLKFNLSGEEITDQATASEVALGLFAPIKMLVSNTTGVAGWLYYPPGSKVNSLQAVLNPPDNAGNSTAYQGGGDTQQLEVIVLLKAQVGVNSKGRAKYLFKHIHDVRAETGAPGVVPALTPAFQTSLATWVSGVGPNNNVVVDPTTGAAPTGWQTDGALLTRQLRRGQKAKS